MLSVQFLFACTGQVIAPHAPTSGLQVTSHAHDDAHVVVPHAPLPVHVTSHLPVLQMTLPHAVNADPEPEPEPEPEPCAVQPIVQSAVLHITPPHAPSVPHVIVHLPALQLTDVHAPAVAQLMSQFQPDGHATAPPTPLIMHVPVPKSHESHVVGHTAASIAASSFAFGSTTQ